VKKLSQAAAAALLIASTPVLADEAGDPNRGHAYARAHCAECHGVETTRDDFSPNVDAPDFAVVANTPGMTERAVGVWLQTPHPSMPNLMIAADDRGDLAAYIMSLKTPGEQP